MKMYKLSLAFLLLVIPFSLFADEDDDVRDLPIRERILLGGNLSLQIGNINTYVVISPNIGYRLTNRLTSGLGLTYQYYRNTGLGAMTGSTSVLHIYGGSLFTRYHILPYIFAHAEYEALNLDSQMGWLVNPETQGSQTRFWEHNYLLGGGYRARLGERASLNLMLLYNFNQNSLVYHGQNPIFRFGIDVRM
jgi:hypothetical protein